MKTGVKKNYKPVPSPLKWHGGKGGFHGKLAQWIISLMPEHTHYVEPFFGGGSVLLYKNPEGVSEVVNDIHSELTQFWHTMQHQLWFREFQRMVEAVPFSQAEFEKASEGAARYGDNEAYGSLGLSRAVSFFIRCRQSLAGRNDTFAPLSKSRTRRGMNEQASAWLTAIEGLPEVHERLKRVVILNDKATEVIRREDSPTTLFYCDPPYPSGTRTTTGEYEHEMTDADHRTLLDLLGGIEGKFILSTYPNDLYHQIAVDRKWRWEDFQIANNAAGGKKKKTMTERVYLNY